MCQLNDESENICKCKEGYQGDGIKECKGKWWIYVILLQTLKSDKRTNNDLQNIHIKLKNE